jgi:hypothetical protein
VPGRNPGQAEGAFLAPLMGAVLGLFPPENCHPLTHGPPGDRRLIFNRELPMWGLGHDGLRFGLVAAMRFRVIEDPSNGPFRVSTLEYIYDIVVESAGSPAGTSALLWHWHPKTTPDIQEPHLHVKSGWADVHIDRLTGAHIPTSRVTFEDVLMFMHTELGFTPRTADWRARVEGSRRVHVDHRTWHDRAP